MKKYGRWITVGVVVLFVAALVLRTNTKSTLTPLVSETWSRGQILGQTSVKRAVTMRPAPDGGMYLAWSTVDGKIELAHVGMDGEVLMDRVLPVSTLQARDPQLQVGSDGHLQLLWREQSGGDAGIHYALLQADGTLVGQTGAVSKPGSRISDAPRLVQGQDGRLHALWTDDDGVRWAALDDTGDVAAEPVLLIPEASSPRVRMDGEGRLHLTWQQKVRGSLVTIHYAILDPEQGELNGAEEIAEVQINGPLQLEAMALGLSQDMGYVFWSVYNTKFDSFTFQYASFPLDAPQNRRVVPWPLRSVEGVRAIAPLDGQQSSLPLVLSKRMMGEEQLDLRATLVTVGEGQSGADEQMLTAPSTAAMKPSLVADDRSNLHVAWLSAGGSEGFRVIYGSNSPEVIENYNALTFVDTFDVALDSVFRLSTAIVSLLVSLGLWAVVPVVGLMVYHLVTSEETLNTRRAQVAVLVAVVVVVLLSFVMPPRLGIDLDWPVLRWIVPAFSVVMTAVVTVSVVRRREEVHLFGVFFLFTIMYSLMQTVLFLVF